MKRIAHITAAALITAAFVGAAPVLDIQSNLAITGQHILLKDIVKSIAAIPDDWADRQIMNAPAPGEPRHYDITTIAYALQKYPDMHEVVLRGQRHLVMASTGVNLAPEQVQRAIRDYISTSEEWKDQELLVDFEPLQDSISIPTGEQAIEIRDCIPQRDDYKFIFNVSISVDGRPAQPLLVHTKIIPKREIWVAKSSMAREHMISSGDLATKFVPETTLKGYIPATEDLVGFEINRAVNPNQALSRHFVIEPLCVKNGDTVNISASRGSLSIILRAKALSAGRRNERIICMNEQSNRRLTVRLTGAREGTVDF